MPDLGDQVFLSAEMREVVAALKAKHAPLFALAERLNTYSHTELFSTEVPKRDEQCMLVACLLQRSISTFQGVVLLASHGMPSEASTLLRSLVEVTFKLVAISRDREVGTTYIREDLAHRLRWIKNLRKLKQPSRMAASETELQNLHEAIEREVAHTKIAKTTAFWFAEKAELTDLYHSTYSVLSGTVHVTIRDLEKILESTDGDITGFNYGPSDEGLDTILLSAVEMQMNCLEAAFAVLPSTHSDGLALIKSNFLELFQQREQE